MKLFLIVLSLLLRQQVSSLRSISAEEYALFPPLRHLDGYSHCLLAEDGAYCVAGANIVTDQPSELYDKIMNFSFSAPRHFDHGKISYGYCMTRRCKEFYTGDSDAALETALGACLTHTLQQEYGLRARVEHAACYRHGDQRRFTALDCVATAVYLTLIGLAIAGTLYDLLATKKNKGYLMCFSIPANWAKLTAPWPQDQSTARLIGINGLRFLTSVSTIFIHSMIPLSYMAENVYSIEEVIESGGYRIIGNLHIIVQTFVFLSGMFMAYSAQASAERSPMTWKTLPKAIFLRWLRHFYSQKAFHSYDALNYLHKRTHTNMPIFFIGMAFGLFVYNWMKNPVDTTNYKRYKWVYWLTVPLLSAVMYAHSYLVLAEGERRSMLVRVLFALFPKPIWGVLLAAIVFGMVCRVENVYRGVLEWPGYVPLARLSYCAYNVHMIIAYWLYASDTQLIHISEINIAVRGIGVVVLSFVLAAVVWLLVEAPSNNVIRKLFPEKKSVLDVNTVTKKTE